MNYFLPKYFTYTEKTDNGCSDKNKMTVLKTKTECVLETLTCFVFSAVIMVLSFFSV